MAIQDKFNKPDIIYKITQDIDLSGGTLTIPSGCTLDFQGGTISNGTLVGNNTIIKTDYSCLSSININGRIKDSVHSYWWKVSDLDNTSQTSLLQHILNVESDIINIDSSFHLINPKIELNGVSNKVLDYSKGFIKVDKSDYSGDVSISYYTVKLLNCNNITIKNMIEEGDVLEHYKYGTVFTGNKLCKGIQIGDNCKNISIINCICNYNIGDGIDIIASNVENVYISDITIKGCICNYNRRQGYSIEAGNNIELIDCVAKGTGQYLKENACGFDIEPWEINNIPQKVTLINCFAEGSENFDFMFSSGVDNHEGEDIQIHNCTFGTMSLYNIKHMQVQHSTVKDIVKLFGNVYEETPVYFFNVNIGLVYLQGISNSYFAECNIYNSNPQSTTSAIGIYGNRITNVVFEGCTISNIENTNRSLLYSSNVDLENIQVSFNACTFKENSVYKSDGRNLFIYFSKVNITNCVFNIKHKLHFYGCLNVNCTNNILYNDDVGEVLIGIGGHDYVDFSKVGKLSFINNDFYNSKYLYDIDFWTQVDDVLEIIQTINTPLNNLYKLTRCDGKALIIDHTASRISTLGGNQYGTSLLNNYDKQKGMSIFDTTINKPVWWNGAEWVGENTVVNAGTF